MALIETIPVKDDYRRKMAYKLMTEGMDASPVQHWAQGLARLGQGALGGYEMYLADQKDKETEAGNNAALIAALTGGAPSTPAMPTPQKPTASPPAPVTSVTPNVGAVPAALTGARPGGPVMPSSKVWGDAEAEAAGLYEKPAQPKIAANGPVALPPQPAAPAPAPASAPVVPTPTDTQMSDARKALAVRMLQSDNPQMRKVGQSIAQALISEQVKPNSYDFKVVGENLVKTDSKGNASIVPGMSATKPTWGVIGKDDFGKEQYGWIDPSTKMTTPGQQSSGPPTITGPDGKPIPIAPGIDPKVIREAASKRAAEEGMPASDESQAKLRGEIQGLPSYKNIAQAAPVYKSMLDAAGRDNRASDVNLIYGMAKVMDPGSVVRESEMSVAQAIATLPQQLQAAVKSQLTESGRLTPELRAAIMTEARSRLLAYQGMFDQDAAMYRGIAERGRMDTRNVLPSFGEFPEYKPAAPPLTKPQKTKTGVSWSVEQ